ncbi:uncharacterized protein LOC118945341 [Oncorhynchus mykiss]|uniref:uncharacterized protein LOC118945341 n=1 Tax=Oncorhynchus mykiss TaxID=8022 RepID=UPI0018783151|nr:uncharacterized protein LOC118945341 [Oncorhynchus mykiss]
MERGILIWSLLLFLALNIVYPSRTLNSIQDLKDFPVHPLSTSQLRLLYWLASQINHIDNNNIMTFNFDPTRGDYGSHYYKNIERVLPPLLNNIGNYYTLGNLNMKNALDLPEYVTKEFLISTHIAEKLKNNRQRLILHAIWNHTTMFITVDQVYLTQHYPPNWGRGSEYDPDNTYRITPNLLREIQTFQTLSATDIQNQYGIQIGPTNQIEDPLQRLALFFKIFKNLKTSYSKCYSNTKQRRRRSESKEECDDLKMKLEVKTTCKGTARISWDDIPKRHLNPDVFVVLYQNKDSEIQLDYTKIIEASGNFNTNAALNHGLQVRLHKSKTNWGTKTPGEIWRGLEFHDTNREIPVGIRGYDASLQLYVKDGKASARLYVRNSFTNWMDVFKSSWVGFYSNGNTGTSTCYTWQWAVYFSKETRSDIPEYDVYVYQSSMAISPGVHARFILWRKAGEKARTSDWEIQRPANINVNINGYDASLQLFVREGYACARLYIKKSFSDWKSKFYYSWVGFYSDENKANTKYDKNMWQWTIKFSKEIPSDIPDYDAYVYQSSLAMSPGVQARFILDHNEMARTLPWEIQRPADSKSPVDINGYDALLQLFVKDNKASARLYIKKSFSDWKSKFYNSWVGFYSDENKANTKYDANMWQWTIKFSKEIPSDIPDYDAYVYQFGRTMSPGVQARFLLSDNIEKARTLPWKN